MEGRFLSNNHVGKFNNQVKWLTSDSRKSCSSSGTAGESCKPNQLQNKPVCLIENVWEDSKSGQDVEHIIM